MPDRDEILSAISGGHEQWKRYIEGLSPSQLRKVEAQLSKLLDDYTHFVEELQYAGTILEHEIKSRDERTEKKRRDARVRRVSLSLRAYLTEPLLDADIPLGTLSLCTKTGAAVLLKALSYTVDGHSIKVTSVNEARRYWQSGHEPWAGYHLHYVREGRLSAGFGWDRPFLDEVFVLSSVPD